MSKTNYDKFLRGEKLTHKQAITAQCYICNGKGEGQGKDCYGRAVCPLYQFMPYNPQKQKKQISPERRAEIAERFKKARQGLKF